MNRFSIFRQGNDLAKITLADRSSVDSGTPFLVTVPFHQEGEYEVIDYGPSGVLIRRIGPPHPDDMYAAGI